MNPETSLSRACLAQMTDLSHQKHRPAALDFAGNFAMEVSRHSREAAGKNFATFGNEFFQNIGVFIVDRVDGDVHPATRHDAVGTAKIGAALSGFRLHKMRN